MVIKPNENNMFDENFILQLANLIVEFYGTNNEERRKEINEILVALPKCSFAFFWNNIVLFFRLADRKVVKVEWYSEFHSVIAA